MTIITAIASRLAGLTLPSVLPWALAAWLASLGGAGAWGWHQGAADVRTQWRAAQAQQDAAAAHALATEIRAAAATAADIAGTLRDTAAAIASTRERTRIIVREVSHAVHADPSLSAARLPADVVRLRREQVEASAAAADAARRAAGR